jgi:hypothetical protein
MRDGPAYLKGFDASRPSLARVYDYWLGGKDNFGAHRELAEQVIAAYPNIVLSVFLDVGTGIPAADNTHEGSAAPGTGQPGGLRRQRPLQVGLCARALDRSGCLKRTREREAIRADIQSASKRPKLGSSKRMSVAAASARTSRYSSQNKLLLGGACRC